MLAHFRSLWKQMLRYCHQECGHLAGLGVPRVALGYLISVLDTKQNMWTCLSSWNLGNEATKQVYKVIWQSAASSAHTRVIASILGFAPISVWSHIIAPSCRRIWTPKGYLGPRSLSPKRHLDRFYISLFHQSMVSVGPNLKFSKYNIQQKKETKTGKI